MSRQRDTDGVLVEWGTTLFSPKRKPTQDSGGATLKGFIAGSLSAQATTIRHHIRATVRPGGKQVMVKITGGGKGMKAIQAHLRYISRLGKDQAGGRGETLVVEDERGQQMQGHQAIKDLANDWRLAGSYIHDESHRKEAFNVILSMPEGTPPEAVLNAAREFAKETFEGHKYAFVLHTDTKSPHVHLAVRAERSDGVRLNPRKADLQRWRERFAARMQAQGVNALATPARARGVQRSWQSLWRQRDPQRVQKPRSATRSGAAHQQSMAAAKAAWAGLETALRTSPRADDQDLAKDVAKYIRTAFSDLQAQPPTLKEPQRGQTRNTTRRPGLGRFERVYGGRSGSARRGRGARFESDLGGPRSLAQAKGIDSLRDLSSVPVVCFADRSEVLLPRDAPHHVEHRGAQPADPLRRHGAGPGAAAGLERVPVRGDSGKALEEALRQARERYGKRLQVQGDAAFKERVANIVVKAKLDVKFTDEALNARVAQLRRQRGQKGPER